MKLKYKLFGLLTIIMMLAMPIPSNAVNPTNPVDQALMMPFSDSYITSDPILLHLKSKKQNINQALVLQLFGNISSEQTAIKSQMFENQSSIYLWGEYLNNSNHIYTIKGESHTMREWYDKLPVVKSTFDTFERISNDISNKSDRELIDYIYYKYPPLASIKKSLENWDYNKVVYVVDHTNLDVDTINKTVPRNKVDSNAWNKYCDKTRL